MALRIKSCGGPFWRGIVSGKSSPMPRRTTADLMAAGSWTRRKAADCSGCRTRAVGRGEILSCGRFARSKWGVESGACPLQDCLLPMRSAMEKARCPYFSLTAGSLPIAEHRQPMRVAVCRCLLVGELIRRLIDTFEPGHAERMLARQGTDADAPVFVGLDLMVVSAATCSNFRKVETCLPRYVALLEEAQLEGGIPPEPRLGDK